MVNERNKEIEAIIEKLGDETHSTQKSLQSQFERKVDALNEKHAQEVRDYQLQVASLSEKYKHEQEQRLMLDENLRTVMRRINDLEIDLNDRNDKIRTLEKSNNETGN